MSSADTAGKGVNKSGGKAKTDSGSSRTRSDKPPSCRRSINLPVPVLKTGEDYGMWKNAALLWCEYNKDEPSNQAIAIHLTLTGRARQITNRIPRAELCSDNGVSILLAKLDAFFLPDTKQRQHLAYSRMHALSRPNGMSIQDFIGDFEEEYFKQQCEGMSLPDAVMSSMLVRACNLTEDKE